MRMNPCDANFTLIEMLDGIMFFLFFLCHLELCDLLFWIKYELKQSSKHQERERKGRILVN